MLSIQAPTLGPILGYTTHEQARIWLRGDRRSTERRYFGVVQLQHPTTGLGSQQYQKLEPHFDMTGVVAFTGLEPNTTYHYRAGWVETDADVELNQLPTDPAELDWGQAEEIPFRTGSNNAVQERTLVVGSCRYLLKMRLLGLDVDVFDERGDKVFRSILAQKDDVDALVMMGDQIYADDLNFFRPDTTMGQFLGRYQEAFGQPYLRRLMQQVPTYMILDDHEIEDNWPQKATQRDRILLYSKAIHAYQIYQVSHSPVFALDAQGYITGTPDRFWYTFRDGCVDCFVMDVRTERVWHEDSTKRSLITRVQMEALQQWLVKGSDADRVKLIVTSVPVFPDLQASDEQTDKWGGFLRERTQLLDFIKQNAVRKVVFMSGDVHCSFTAELTCKQDPTFKVVSVISSSFFWPYPHMRATNFQLDGALRVPKDHPNEYHVGSASTVFSEDNFGRLTCRPDRISVTYFDRKGKQLSPRPATHSFSTRAEELGT
ncbi:alkaline phosphatase D family protein [Hymenobacter sp. GOD-10R]|uniref:alkaline phosphatase D family protein n=1 Tax=Hymenobacter sp. GOD-10R TaxID=3093922 RepID=UPI002D76E861|nr:alkaline phosphatase D family protein [Hymenobacter sp. GOD-10R]WRQ26886.1 alkaline phosphatase D family protein [Hymenobacter sp. GOD-10R]